MADNTTVYNTVVEVEVKGQKEVEDMNKTLEEGDGKFKSLRGQIRETTVALQSLADQGKAGTKEFKALSDKLDDLGDAQKRVAFQSGQIEDKLSALPGPIGAIGKGFASAKSAVDTFGTGLAVATGGVTLLIGFIVSLKKSLESTAEGQATLNRVSQAFSSVLGPILATLEKIAVPLFNGLAAVIEKVAKAFAFFAEKLGVSQAKIKEATLSVDKVQQATNEAEKKRQDEQVKKVEEANRKKLEANQKYAEKRKKQLEEQKKKEDDANKVLTEAFIATLDSRDKELFKLGQSHNERMLALDKAGVKDRTTVLEQFRIEEAAINKKYDDEIAKKAEEDKKKRDDEAEKLKKETEEKDKKLAEDKAAAESQAREDSARLLIADAEFNKTIKAQTFQEEINLYDNVRALQRDDMVAKKASADALLAFDKETATARIQIERAQQETKLAIVSNALGTLAQAVGEQTVAGKALAIAQATIDTYAGATKALATYPPPFGAIAAGTVILAGLLNIKKIVSTQIPKVPGGKGVSDTTSGASIAAPTVSSTPIPQISTGGGSNPSAQIAETLANSQKTPIKTYVLTQDVSSQQAFQRRTNNAAVL